MSEHELAPEERLRALDPAASAPYEPADLAGMLARVTATERVEKVRIADGLRLRVGAAVTAAALLTVGAIGAIEAAAPSLSVLALGAKQGTASGAQQSPTPEMIALNRFHFVAGPALSDASSSSPIYRIAGPTAATSDAERISGDLGVPPPPAPAVSPPENSWSYTGRAGKVEFWNDAGYLSWDYQSASSGVVTSPPASTTASSLTPVIQLADNQFVDVSAAIAAANRLMSSLDVPTRDVGSIESTPFPNGKSTDVEVNFPWQPGGIATGLNFSFTYDAAGHLQYASGFDGSSSRGDAYPLLSPRDGVAELQHEVDQFTYPGTGAFVSPPSGTTNGITSTSGASSSTPPTPGSTPNNGDTTTTVPTITVELGSETMMYALYTLSDGSSALLPTYLYSGTDGERWMVIAIEPQYVHLAPEPRPMIF
jgi:hypothetical protein